MQRAQWRKVPASGRKQLRDRRADTLTASRLHRGPGDCKYTSLKQCQAALSGTVGTCVRNNAPR
ncbi:DUF3551 domain-containing protein [Afipia massiliensis]|uniref:DUF3551 domain-containing protein n=1 Tax=Afipia massiliensis TaxID=211460 RepID=UPI00161804C9